MRRIITPIALVVPFMLMAQSPDGPDAPNLAIIYDPVGSEFTFVLSNSPGSNNYGESYTEWINEPVPTPDQYWRFQGYAIYQFRSPADADDSLQYVILDPQRALPVILIDKSDTITTMLHNLHTIAPDTCTPVTFVLDNSGLSGSIINSFDPFTMFGYDPDETYCFVALAFAYNKWHHHATCDTLQQVLFSKKTAAGALQVQCIDLAHVGMEEQLVENITLSPIPTASTFTLTGGMGARYQVRCVSMLGALMLDRTVTSGEIIDASAWAPGPYRVVALDGQGRSLSRTLVVER
ncbi:MAG: hypothetical protein ABI432_10095 [Flavobacteriales bacterium]